MKTGVTLLGLGRGGSKQPKAGNHQLLHPALLGGESRGCSQTPQWWQGGRVGRYIYMCVCVCIEGSLKVEGLLHVLQKESVDAYIALLIKYLAHEQACKTQKHSEV